MASKKLNGHIISLYNRVIAIRFLNRNNRVCRRIRAALLHNICWRCEASFGEANPDRLFYLIRSSQNELGFFGLYNYVVDGIIEAISIGAEPVVDWQYYPNDYLCDDNNPCTVNAWEQFFKPMSNISLDEVYRSKNVIMSNSEYLNGGKIAYEYEHPEAMKETSELIKKYIVLRDDVADAIDRESINLGINQGRILGVKCRGTDFKETRPQFHAICPDAEYTATSIDEMEKEWGRFDKIYLVTEDSQMNQDMKELYPDRLVSSSEDRIETANGQWLNKMYDGKAADYKYKSMQDYLKSVYILANCDALIAPRVGATNGAMRIKGGFQLVKIVSLGAYQ